MFPPLFQACAADTAVQAVLGSDPVRLYPFGEAPAGVIRPYAVWQVIGGSPGNYLGDRPDMDGYSLQVDVYAETDVSVYAAAVALRDVIETRAYITAWRGESRDPATHSYRYSFDVDWLASR
jgi:hypothetical protein